MSESLENIFLFFSLLYDALPRIATFATSTLGMIAAIVMGMRTLFSPLKDPRRENLKLDLEIRKLYQENGLNDYRLLNSIEESIEKGMNSLYDNERRQELIRKCKSWFFIGVWLFVRPAWDAALSGEWLYAMALAPFLLWGIYRVYLYFKAPWRLT